jgi:hypothetical protein
LEDHMSVEPRKQQVSLYGTIAVTALVAGAGALALPLAIALWHAVAEATGAFGGVVTSALVFSAMAMSVVVLGAAGAAIHLQIYLTPREPDWGWWTGLFIAALWAFSIAATLLVLLG